MKGVDYSFCGGTKLPLLRSIPLSYFDNTNIFSKKFETRDRNYIGLTKNTFRELSFSITKQDDTSILPDAIDPKMSDAHGRLLMTLHFREIGHQH
jgi:hypothetical protein